MTSDGEPLTLNTPVEELKLPPPTELNSVPAKGSDRVTVTVSVGFALLSETWTVANGVVAVPAGTP